MSKMDVSTWKQFRVGDLFLLERPDSRVVGQYISGDMPFVASGMQDNGISCWVEPHDEYDFDKGHCLTVSPLDGSCFYQPNDFLGRGGSGASINILRNESLSEFVNLFVATIIKNTLHYEAGYTNLFAGNKLLNTMISLPATPSGEPDWDYMENYMKAVMEREEVFAEHLASLTAEAVADGHPIDVSAWGEFHLYDIFDIDMGNKFDRGKMPVGEDINFVGRTGLNNGVNAVCSKYQETEPYTAGYLTLALGGTIGACFVQNEPFYTSQNVIVLKPKKDVPFVVKQFMACVIYNVSRSRYCAFSDELNKHIKTDFVFSLPVTPSGEPDWAYMEQFMQQQMDKSQQLVEHLDQIWN